MGHGVLVLARFELKGDGVQFSNLAQSPTEGSAFSMATVFGMLILDTFLYLILTWLVFDSDFNYPHLTIFVVKQE